MVILVTIISAQLLEEATGFGRRQPHFSSRWIAWTVGDHESPVRMSHEPYPTVP